MQKFSNKYFLFGLAALFIILLPTRILASMDFDDDNLSDLDEINIYHTNPLIADTDNDGFSDGEEVINGYSPLHGDKLKLSQIDSDSDNLIDSWEVVLGTDLLNPDSDNDSYVDGLEVTSGYDPTSVSSDKIEKSIIVSLENQLLSYYFANKELEHFKISSGVASMPTPVGKFTVLDKVLSKNYGGSGFNFSYPNTKWNLHFTTDVWRYYIHGAYWHNNFGQPMSHGCVNVSYDNMEKLYNFAEVGTTIKIF